MTSIVGGESTGLHGKGSQPTTLDDVLEFAKTANKQFLQQELVVIDSKVPSLYVCQKEWATVHTSVSNKIRYLGSSKATTCVLLFFYSKRAFSCAHYDGAESVKFTLDKQIESILTPYACASEEEREIIKVSMVGGFVGDGITEGHTISKAILAHLDNYDAASKNIRFELDVVLICRENVTENRRYAGKLEPIHGSAVYDRVSGTIKPCRWENLECITPELLFRSASLYTADKAAKALFDYNNNAIVVGQRQYYSVNTDFIEGILNSTESDEELLLRMSTSPYAEEEDFIKDLKASFAFLKENPYYDDYYIKMKGRRAYTLRSEAGSNGRWVWEKAQK